MYPVCLGLSGWGRCPSAFCLYVSAILLTGLPLRMEDEEMRHFAANGHVVHLLSKGGAPKKIVTFMHNEKNW
ncbi:hypothetical protein GCM10007159_41010 [Modicisalibacter luteus]|nr:hypothetical protein GCM10007159_41010 [Halomonas lutea]